METKYLITFLILSLCVNIYFIFKYIYNNFINKNNLVDYSATAEKIYIATFWVFVVIVVGINVGNVFFVKIGLPPITIQDNLLAFIERTIGLFILPVTINLVGDKLPLLIDLFKVFVELKTGTKQNKPTKTVKKIVEES